MSDISVIQFGPFGPSGVLINTFVCWITFVVGIMLCYSLWKSGRNDQLRFFSLFFWAIMSLVFFILGLSSIFTWAGHPEIEKLLNYFIDILVQLSFIPISYYLTFRAFNKRKLSIFVVGIFSVLFLVFVGLLVKYGEILPVSEETINYYGHNFVPHFKAEIVLLLSMASLVVVAFYDLFINSFKRFFNKNPYNSKKIISTISLLVLVFAGGLDQAAFITTGWPLIVVRIFILLSFLLAFFSFPDEEKPVGFSEKDLVV